jgi:Uma2 family endonuclease
MVAPVPVESASVSELLRLPLPDRLPDGSEPEARVVVSGISWNRYLQFDNQLGEDRPAPRFYYLEGELEVMTTSREHERIKEWIGGLLDYYTDFADIVTFPYGQATMRLSFKQAGAEPDKSWCIGEDKKVPDLVLEIALTSGGLPKLDIYKRFKVPEVWIWRCDNLEIYCLTRAGDYARKQKSLLLPGFNVSLLERCVAIRLWPEARKIFRAGLAQK